METLRDWIEQRRSCFESLRQDVYAREAFRELNAEHQIARLLVLEEALQVREYDEITLVGFPDIGDLSIMPMTHAPVPAKRGFSLVLERQEVSGNKAQVVLRHFVDGHAVRGHHREWKRKNSMWGPAAYVDAWAH
jgi:hypothetical protein